MLRWPEQEVGEAREEGREGRREARREAREGREN